MTQSIWLSVSSWWSRLAMITSTASWASAMGVSFRLTGFRDGRFARSSTTDVTGFRDARYASSSITDLGYGVSRRSLRELLNHRLGLRGFETPLRGSSTTGV